MQTTPRSLFEIVFLSTGWFHAGMLHSPFSLLRALVLLLALAVVPFALLGLCCVVTWEGRLLFLGAVLLGTGPLLWCLGEERDRTGQTRLGQALLLAGVALLIVMISRAPDGKAPADGRMHTRFSKGAWHYDCGSFAAILPEIDQIHLGYVVALLFDPLFTRAQYQDLSAMTDTLYAEMQADAEFRAAGSALPSIYSEVTLMDFRDGHYFHCIPKKLDRTKPAPALVFLHGSGGNFKVYTWLLSKLAEEVGCTVIAPSFGMGNWEKRGGYEAITRAIEDAGKYAAIDPENIHLMGLSNGGKGVSLAESAPGPRFRSLIFLSGVFHNRITTENLAAKLKPRPVLVISGGKDDRVPWEYVSGYADKMKRGGLDVATHEFPEDDHFLFFRQREAVLRLVTEWITSTTAHSAP
ncbi:MAG: hypothetical protein ACO1TE_13480 [Prosthecobacter sp.]